MKKTSISNKQKSIINVSKVSSKWVFRCQMHETPERTKQRLERANLAHQEKVKKAALASYLNGVKNFFDDTLKRHGYENRVEQQNMATEIAAALATNQHIAVEAGVGIGKSYAYLIPILLYTRKYHTPIIIATSTIALQEQLLNDLKKLQEILGYDRPLQDVVLAKGQTHYICQKRFQEYLNSSTATIELVTKLQLELSKNHQERSALSFPVQDETWNEVNIKNYSKHYCEDCDYKCAYRNMRNILLKTEGIVLCNQDFLIAHLLTLDQKQQGLINRYVGVIVVDEAHNLDDKVRSATSEHINPMLLSKKVENLKTILKANDSSAFRKKIHIAKDAILSFNDCLVNQIQNQIKESVQYMGYSKRYFFNMDKPTCTLWGDMTEKIRDVSQLIQDNDSKNKFYELNCLDSVVEILLQVYKNYSNWLVWIERNGDDVELVCCPKNTSEVIQKLFFGGRTRTVLTSATLTTSNQGTLEEQYSYFIKSVGFPLDRNGVLSQPKPSPYPYDKHAMIYYCDDLPHPTRNHDEFLQQGIVRLSEILNISEGKALVLFTAREDMEEVYTRLSSRNLPYKILMQQSGASQDHILEEFKHDTNSVLLGTGIYWEGINVEGESLSNLVIFKLPFPAPDPIIEYKELLARDPLWDVMVPEMISKLKQGIGRLIRNFNDTGIVSILDSRLGDSSSAPYRNTVWNSLPIHNRTSDLDKLRNFYSCLKVKKSEDKTSVKR